MATPPSFPLFRSFTIEANGLARQLLTQVTLSEAYDPASGQAQPPARPFVSIWDTGATASAISSKVVSALSLKPIGMTQFHTANGIGTAQKYLVNIHLPNNVEFIGLTVAEVKLVGNEDVLIGMDVIAQGDFSITNCGGKTCMSFRVPSIARIDYNEEAARINAKIANQQKAAAARQLKEQQREFRAQMGKRRK